MERYNSIIDLEPFAYIHFYKIEPSTCVHAIYLSVHEKYCTMFNAGLYININMTHAE